MKLKEYLPIINGIVIKLSYAKPAKNRQVANDQKLKVLAVAIEEIKATAVEHNKPFIRPF